MHAKTKQSRINRKCSRASLHIFRTPLPGRSLIGVTCASDNPFIRSCRGLSWAAPKGKGTHIENIFSITILLPYPQKAGSIGLPPTPSPVGLRLDAKTQSEKNQVVQIAVIFSSEAREPGVQFLGNAHGPNQNAMSFRTTFHTGKHFAPRGEELSPFPIQLCCVFTKYGMNKFIVHGEVFAALVDVEVRGFG